jgi:predicted aspartyl protease
MRQTCIGAIESSVCARLLHTRARVWAVAVLLGLLSGHAKPAFASFQPGPSARSHVAVETDPSLRAHSADSTTPLSSSSEPYPDTYWTAFADLDLAMLRDAAQTDPQARFAEGMTLLAAAKMESAESAFLVVSQQIKDLNIAVAAQVMLAMTLRYERKWSQLRDLPFNSQLSADDRMLTSDLERWGKAFAEAEPEVMSFPETPVELAMKITAVGTPTIRVRINGKQYDFWVDTGSSMTVLSSRVAEETNIDALSDDTLTVRTFAGSAPVRAATVRRLEIGPIVLTNSPAVIIDQSLMYLRATVEGVSSRGIQVDGIIGWDTIRQLDLTMNYVSRRITLRRPIQRGIDGRTRNLAWVGKPLVEVRTKAGGKHHFTLDTGAQASFLNATILEKTGVSTKSADNRVFGIARTGRQTNRVVPSLRLDVSGKPLHLQDVIVYGPISSGLINCDGILGSDIARYGPIHIDATNGLFSVGELDAGDDVGE